MAYPMQFQQHEYQPVEWTWTIRHNQHLLRPDAECIDSLNGVIGRMQSLYGKQFRLYYTGNESTHIHIVGAALNPQVAAAVKRHLASNMAKEIQELRGLDRGGIWARRCRSIPILSDLNKRLRYMISHGFKSGLVAKITDWPGLGMLDVVLKGEALTGTWYNRTAFGNDLWDWKRRKRAIQKAQISKRAKRARLQVLYTEKPQLKAYATVYPVTLTPPPTMAGLSPLEQQAEWQKLVNEAEVEHAPALRKSGAKRPVLGLAKVLATDPLKLPRKRPRRTGAPWAHGTLPEKQVWRERYEACASVFRGCMSRIAWGATDVEFRWENWTPLALADLRAAGPEVMVDCAAA